MSDDDPKLHVLPPLRYDKESVAPLARAGAPDSVDDFFRAMVDALDRDNVPRGDAQIRATLASRLWDLAERAKKGGKGFDAAAAKVEADALRSIGRIAGVEGAPQRALPQQGTSGAETTIEKKVRELREARDRAELGGRRGP